MTTSGWALRRIVNPAIEPVTLLEAKEQCQVDADLTEQDNRITGYIKAARALAETYCKQSFVEQKWRLSAGRWPDACDYGIELPNGPILALESVSYLDNDGQRIVMDASAYAISEDSSPPKLYPVYGTQWPLGRYTPGAVQIDYWAGYPSAGSPADATGIPDEVKQAILLLVAHWFNAREEVVIGSSVASIPFGFERVLDGLKVYP